MPISEKILEKIKHDRMGAILVLLDGKKFPDINFKKRGFNLEGIEVDLSEEEQVASFNNAVSDLIEKKLKCPLDFNNPVHQVHIETIIVNHFDVDDKNEKYLNEDNSRIDWEKLLGDLAKKFNLNLRVNRLYKSLLKSFESDLIICSVIKKREKSVKNRLLKLIEKKGYSKKLADYVYKKIIDKKHGFENMEKIFGKAFVNDFHEKKAHNLFPDLVAAALQLKLNEFAKILERNKIDAIQGLTVTLSQITDHNTQVQYTLIQELMSAQKREQTFQAIFGKNFKDSLDKFTVSTASTVYELLLSKSKDNFPELYFLLKQYSTKALENLAATVKQADLPADILADNILNLASGNGQNRKKAIVSIFGESSEREFNQLILNISDQLYNLLLTGCSHFSSHLVSVLECNAYYADLQTYLKKYIEQYAGNAEQLSETLLKLVENQPKTLQLFMQALYGEKSQFMLGVYAKIQTGNPNVADDYNKLFDDPLINYSVQIKALFSSLALPLMLGLNNQNLKLPGTHKLLQALTDKHSYDEIIEAIVGAFECNSQFRNELLDACNEVIVKAIPAPASILEEVEYIKFIERSDIKAQPNLHSILQAGRGNENFIAMLKSVALQKKLPGNLRSLTQALAMVDKIEEIQKAIVQQLFGDNFSAPIIATAASEVRINSENDKYYLIGEARLTLLAKSHPSLTAVVFKKPELAYIGKLPFDVWSEKIAKFASVDVTNNLEEFSELIDFLEVNQQIDKLTAKIIVGEARLVALAETHVELLASINLDPNKNQVLEKISSLTPNTWQEITTILSGNITVVELEQAINNYQCGEKYIAELPALQQWINFNQQKVNIIQKLGRLSLADWKNWKDINLVNIGLLTPNGLEVTTYLNKIFNINGVVSNKEALAIIDEAQHVIRGFARYEEMHLQLIDDGLTTIVKKINEMLGVKKNIILGLQSHQLTEEALDKKIKVLKISLAFAEFLNANGNEQNAVLTALSNFFEGLVTKPLKTVAEKLVPIGKTYHKEFIREAAKQVKAELTSKAIKSIFIDLPVYLGNELISFDAMLVMTVEKILAMDSIDLLLKNRKDFFKHIKTIVDEILTVEDIAYLNDIYHIKQLNNNSEYDDIVSELLELGKTQLSKLIVKAEQFLEVLKNEGLIKLAERLQASAAWILLLAHLKESNLSEDAELEFLIKDLQIALAESLGQTQAACGLDTFFGELFFTCPEIVSVILPADGNYHVEMIQEAKKNQASAIYQTILTALNAAGLTKLVALIDLKKDLESAVKDYFQNKTPLEQNVLVAKVEQLKISLSLAELLSVTANPNNGAILALTDFLDGLVNLPSSNASKIIVVNSKDHEEIIKQARVTLLSKSATPSIKRFILNNAVAITLKQDVIKAATFIALNHEQKVDALKNYRDRVSRQEILSKLMLGFSGSIWQAFIQAAATEFAKAADKSDLALVVGKLLGVTNNNITADEIVAAIENAFSEDQKNYINLVREIRQREHEQPDSLSQLLALLLTDECTKNLDNNIQNLKDLFHKMKLGISASIVEQPFSSANKILSNVLQTVLGIQNPSSKTKKILSSAIEQIKNVLLTKEAKLQHLLAKLKEFGLEEAASRIEHTGVGLKYAVANNFLSENELNKNVIRLRLKLTDAQPNNQVNAYLLEFVNRLVVDEILIAEPIEIDNFEVLINPAMDIQNDSYILNDQRILIAENRRIIAEARYGELVFILEKNGLSECVNVVKRQKANLFSQLQFKNLPDNLFDRIKALCLSLAEIENTNIAEEDEKAEENNVSLAFKNFFDTWVTAPDQFYIPEHRALIAQVRYMLLVEDIVAIKNTPISIVFDFLQNEKNYEEIHSYLRTHNVSSWKSLLDAEVIRRGLHQTRLLGIQISDEVANELAQALSPKQEQFISLINAEDRLGHKHTVSFLCQTKIMHAIQSYLAVNNCTAEQFKFDIRLKLATQPPFDINNQLAKRAALQATFSNLFNVVIIESEADSLFAELINEATTKLIHFVFSYRAQPALMSLLAKPTVAALLLVYMQKSSVEELKNALGIELAQKAPFIDQAAKRGAVRAFLHEAINIDEADITDAEADAEFFNEMLSIGRYQALLQQDDLHDELLNLLNKPEVRNVIQLQLTRQTVDEFKTALKLALVNQPIFDPTDVAQCRSALFLAGIPVADSSHHEIIAMINEFLGQNFARYLTFRHQQRDNGCVIGATRVEIAAFERLFGILSPDVFKAQLVTELAKQNIDWTEASRNSAIQTIVRKIFNDNNIILQNAENITLEVANELWASLLSAEQRQAELISATYTAIYNGIPTQLQAIRDWMSLNRERATAFLSHANLANANFVDEVVNAFAQAKTEIELRTAIKKLFGRPATAPQTQPAALAQLGFAAAVREGLCFNLLLNNVDIKTTPQLVAVLTANFEVIARSQPDNTNEVVFQAQIANFFTAKTLDEAVHQLKADWHLPDVVAFVIAPHIIALSAYKHGLTHVAARPDLIAFLEHPANKLSVLQRVCTNARNMRQSDMHVWMQQQLDALQASQQNVYDNSVQQLLGQNLLPEQVRLASNIRIVQPLPEDEKIIAPLFMRWLHSKPQLYRALKVNTRHWSCEAREYRVNNVLKLLLDPTRANTNQFQAQLFSNESRVALLPATANIDLTPDDLVLLVGEARLLYWLKCAPLFAAAIIKSNVWESWARELGSISNVRQAKSELETLLKQYCNTAQPAIANIPYEIARTELCLADFEKRNPALIRWFRNSPWWTKIINTLKEYSPARIDEILLGISYLFACGNNKKLSKLRTIYNNFFASDEDKISFIMRSLFTQPLAKMADELGSVDNDIHIEARKIFGMHIPAITLLANVSVKTRDAYLSDAELGAIINSSRSAIAVSKLKLHIENDLASNESNAVNEFEQIYKPAAFVENLTSQAGDDEKLFEQLDKVNGKYIDRTELRKDATALALAMNAYSQVRAALDYFRKKHAEIESQLKAAADMHQQINALPDNLKSKLQTQLSRAKAAYVTLQGYAVKYQNYINKIDRVFNRYDARIYGLTDHLAQHHGKFLLYHAKGLLAGIVDDTDNFDINEALSDLEERRAADGAEVAAAVATEQNELVPGKRYVQASVDIDPDTFSPVTKYAFSVVSKDEGYLAEFHINPQKPKLFEPLICYFKGINTPYTESIGDLVKKAFEASDAAYARGEGGVLTFNFVDKKMLQESLIWAYTINIIRRRNGEREAPIRYFSAHDASDLINTAQKRAATMIAQKDAHVAAIRSNELESNVNEQLAESTRAAHRLGRRLAN